MDTKLKVKTGAGYTAGRIIASVLLFISAIGVAVGILNYSVICAILKGERAGVRNGLMMEEEIYYKTAEAVYLHPEYYSESEKKELRERMDKYESFGFVFALIDYDFEKHTGKTVYSPYITNAMTSDEFMSEYDTTRCFRDSTYNGKSCRFVYGLTESGMSRYENLFHNRMPKFIAIIVLSIIALAFSIIFLCIFAGRRTKGVKLEKADLKYYDIIFTDVLINIYLVLLLGMAIIVNFFVFHTGDMILGIGIYTNTGIIISIALVVGIAILAFMTMWLCTTLSKKIKLRIFFRNSLIYIVLAGILRFIWRWIKAIWHKLSSPLTNYKNATGKRRAAFFCLGILGAFLLSIILGLIADQMTTYHYNRGFAAVLSSIVFITIAYVLYLGKLFNILNAYDQVKIGIEKLKDGDLTYRIPKCGLPDIDNIAENVNNIGDGMEKALSNAISSERTKTELITNVSHDLKTPLTSIISYADLLSKDETITGESRGYVEILKQKSERLKNIISDLFTLTKSTTGQDKPEMELIDLNKLIEQTLAELSDRMEKSGFMIKKNLPDGGAPIYGDGKKLYRVFLNLFDNALKYSMPGTRIFVAVHQDENKFTVRIQNTASYEMDFDESEIRERFVRGDKSRSTEGSGLGLSIAESFTKLCGGDFEIKTDGDQFTVILTFNRAE